MPARNVEKVYVVDTYYHVYNRGVEKRAIFEDDMDKAVFLNLLKRYLGSEVQKDKQGREYPNYSSRIDVLAFCLMTNHYHLLVYQHDETAMTELLRSLCTAYTMYFNRKYKRVGHLFQDRFKASRITNDAYLQHISRYIHLNPREYRNYEFSSLPYYLDNKQADWIQPGKILELFEDETNYLDFVKDYEDYKAELEDLRTELANG